MTARAPTWWVTTDGNGNPERFTRIEIGERDGWIWGICDEPIDKTLRFPNQQSPSLDHIKPLSLGGGA
jgi:hypothetical protein